MHIIYTRVNTFYGYNWYVLFCYLLTKRSAAAKPSAGVIGQILSL
jgi:hypothetical protein